MILTKKRYGKNDQYIAWHGYQSFPVGEIEPELAHEIGVKLAREMWGDRFQILVTTHLNKGHIHNHFCFTPYLSGMEKSTTTQNPRYKGSGTVPTGCAGSMDYPSLKIPGNPQAGLPGWMKKPGNLRGIMFTGKILKKRCIAATTWKNSSSIWFGKAMRWIVEASTGSCGFPYTRALRGWIQWGKWVMVQKTGRIFFALHRGLPGTDNEDRHLGRTPPAVSEKISSDSLL